MWHLHPTEQWIDEVVRLLNERQLKPEESRFIMAFFSSLDNEFVDYFKSNKDRISSFSGRNVHVFAPLIYEGNIIPDENWRYMRSEFKSLGIPIGTDPTFVFFNLERWHHDAYEPSFFAGFPCRSFANFPDKFKRAIDTCVGTTDTQILARRLTELFLTENLIPHDQVDHQLKHTISNRLPTATLFVSYSSQDKAAAKALVHDLSGDPSLRLWIDEREMLAGQDIQHTITRALRDSDYLLVLISEHSTKSSWVNFEVSQFMAIADGQHIIPLILTKGHAFGEPIDNLLRRLNYLDFSDPTNWKHNIVKLREALLKKDTR